eukprot:s202_g25.t1
MDGDIEAAQQALSRCRNGMEKLYSLDKQFEDPADDDKDGEDEAHGAIADKPLEGESITYWAITNPDLVNPEPIPLPHWFSLPIDQTILIWKKEHQVWQRRLEKRSEQGKDSLPPKQNQCYQEWLKATERTLVLDKKKQAVVKNPASKSQATLRKTCLMLVVHPAVDAADLWIKAGNDKKWNLHLMRGEQVDNSNVPAEVDHFSGKIPLEHEPMNLEDEDEEKAAKDHQIHDAGMHDCLDNQNLSEDDDDGDLDPSIHSGWLFIHESDSEADDDSKDQPGERVTRARVCEQRPEYQELDKLGLVNRPPGCSIGIHPGAEVWRASAPDSKNHGRCYGVSAGRNAKQALLRVVELMLTDYLDKNKDRLAKGQLQRVRDMRSQEPAHKD